MWEKIYLQSNNVQGETEKAILISMPSNSGYKKFSFWHPKKLTEFVGKNDYLIGISFTKDFIFKLKKYGRGQYNFNKVLDEKELNSEEFKNALNFGDAEVISDLIDE